MEGKLLSPVWDSNDPTVSHSTPSRRMLRRNRSDSEILDKDVPPISVQGRNINLGGYESYRFFFLI